MSFLPIAWLLALLLHPWQGIPTFGPPPAPTAAGGTVVAYENNVASSYVNSNVTSKTQAITLGGASLTRGIVVDLIFRNNAVAITSVAIGAETFSLVANTDSGTSISWFRTMEYVLTTTDTGVKTITASWTTATTMAIFVRSFTGVNQTTPTKNGTFVTGTTATSLSRTLAANAGDLTLTDFANETSSVPTWTTNQTQTGTVVTGLTNSKVYTDIGPGTVGPITHTWSGAASLMIAMSGCVLVHN
jgi:hypothetical protein